MREINCGVLLTASGMVGLVREVAAKRKLLRAWQAIPLISVSSVVTYGSDSKTARYKVMCEYNPPVQLMRVDYSKTLLYKEDNSFLRSNIAMEDIELRGVSVLVISIDY